MLRIMALVFSFVLFSPVICLAQEKERFFDLGMEVRLISFDFNSINVQVSDIPVQFRQIRVHKNDTYLGLNGRIVTVPGDTIKTGYFTQLSPSFGPELKIWRFKSLVGIVFFNFPIYPMATRENKNSTREIHQYDSETYRGTGTPLVFYAVDAAPLMSPVSWLTELEFSPEGPASMLVGLGESHFKLRIQNGWDRYDALETYENHDIFYGTFRKEYLGMRLKNKSDKPNGIDTSLLFILGRSSNNGRVPFSANGISVSLKDSYYINIALSFSTSNII